jgi:lipopolysaccharide/colanic/teichoic acid biosynthesis glycosyltransferase
MTGSFGSGARRAFDIIGALVLLALLAPVLLFGALVVIIRSGRPVFFGHERVGRNGRRFRCLKLRTMRIGAEQHLECEPELQHRYLNGGYKLPNGSDPRITRPGRWLRRMYIDEIPQLFNVIGGSMSLVGPRPVVPSELREYGAEVDELLGVRPGIIGEWTSRGRERPEYPERARLELDYVRNRTPVRDLVILVRSVPVVLRGQGQE